MSKKPILLIDGNALAFNSLFKLDLSMDKLTLYTTVIKGFIKNMVKLTQQFHTNQFVFAWDSDVKPSIRKQIFEGYKDRYNDKSDTERKLDAIGRAQFKILKNNVIPALGYQNSFEQHGLEGDDIIASVVLNNPQKRFIVVSSDHDLWQLLSNNCIQTFIRKPIMNVQKFKQKWDIDPHEWGMVKAIGGCISDTVPGVPGVKEITAIKYLKGTLKQSNKTYSNIVSTNGQKIIERNKQLVILPYKDTKPLPISFNESLYISNYKKVCSKYKLFELLQPLNIKLVTNALGIIQD